MAPLPNLAEIASTAPSHNIQLISIFHDLAQARSRYAQQAETVVNSHRARMLLPGVADLETLRYFSGLVGEEERRELTRTTGRGGATRSYGTAARAADLAGGAAAAARWPRAAALRAAGAGARAAAHVVRRPRGCARLAELSVRPPVEDPRLCREWFEDLWLDVCRLRERYMLPVRTCWWENPLQVETLAALAAWVERYDSGEWDDPPGKLALLYDLERVAGIAARRQ